MTTKQKPVNRLQPGDVFIAYVNQKHRMISSYEMFKHNVDDELLVLTFTMIDYEGCSELWCNIHTLEIKEMLTYRFGESFVII